MQNTNVFTVDIRDPRLVIGEQLALSQLVKAGLREPGPYQCGPGTQIDSGFAMQYQSMHAPHPREPLRKLPGYLPVAPGPEIFRIESPLKQDHWRHPFIIRLLVRLVGDAWPDAPFYQASNNAAVFGVPAEVSAALKALQSRGYTDAMKAWVHTEAEWEEMGVTLAVLDKLATTPVPRQGPQGRLTFARKLYNKRPGTDEHMLELKVNLVP
ncbi:hypothetical protein [Cupriavidus nantongensis]|uniref:Uncharacterized protein n=1 Tax=Cupriavidus nantongensis TaxID=1796606 RepID=A0A142JIS3_9BURK|nr:hypothetical protein [Cupriavidus nantongensis]AMR77985.1 hypothetical protein A2G96_09665 [Cupriavidus nantongensis]